VRPQNLAVVVPPLDACYPRKGGPIGGRTTSARQRQSRRVTCSSPRALLLLKSRPLRVVAATRRIQSSDSIGANPRGRPSITTKQVSRPTTRATSFSPTAVLPPAKGGGRVAGGFARVRLRQQLAAGSVRSPGQRPRQASARTSHLGGVQWQASVSAHEIVGATKESI
jgi:hypothetical protein